MKGVVSVQEGAFCCGNATYLLGWKLFGAYMAVKREDLKR